MDGLATEAFIDLVNRDEPAIELDVGMLLIATHARPGLDFARQRRRLDELAAGIAEPTIDALRRHVYGDQGFIGDPDVMDLRCSFLPDVLDRKRGLPISLGVLLIELGRRAGIPLVGVGMPGHFLLRPAVASGVFLDPTAAARAMDERACRDLFGRIHPGARWDRALLADNGPREVLARVLANLKHAYAARHDAAATLWVTRLRAAIPGVGLQEQVELAEALATLGRYGEAADTLEVVAATAPGEAAQRMASRVRTLRSRLN
jgi:regulator of sirC expression with transglutaminase-like and TPR domain